MKRYRVTDEQPYGTVSVHWTNDLADAAEVAGETPTRQVYDEVAQEWIPLFALAAPMRQIHTPQEGEHA